MAVHSCEDGTFLRRAAASELRVGDCLFDGAGATEVYYTDAGRASGWLGAYDWRVRGWLEVGIGFSGYVGRGFSGHFF